MITATLKAAGRQQPWLLPVLVGAAYALLAAVYLRGFLQWNSLWLLTLGLLPLLSQPGAKQQHGKWLPVAAAAALAVAALTAVTTFYYLAFLLAMWWSFRSLCGSFNLYQFLILLIASPAFKYLMEVGSFPLRLQLTAWAVQLLQLTGTAVEAAGNVIVLNGSGFSVDPACAGLSMLTYSVVIALLVLARLQRSTGYSWPVPAIAGLLCVMLLLNIVSNLARILVLVLFRILPDSPLHGAVGLLCLVVYAVLPFFFLTRYLSRTKAKTNQNPENEAKNPGRKLVVFNLLLLLLLALAGLRVQHVPHIPDTAAPLALEGYQRAKLDNGVWKYSHSKALVYAKPLRGFYSTEHHPLICWEGSGYHFRNVVVKQVLGRSIYFGTLEKGDEKLATAWWMDNGSTQTIEQLEWRWRMLKGEPPFRLLNVTAANEKELKQAVKQVLFNQ